MKRALLIINRVAGIGHDETTEELSLAFEEALREHAKVSIALVSDHPSARDRTAEFMQASDEPAVVIAGGGGGTLRAVIEGICGEDNSSTVPGPERIRVGALRMGSGNVVAKRFGVPRDPLLGLQGLLKNLEADLTAPCSVMRCKVWNSAGHSKIHHAVTMVGLGQFGRTPGDLARWKLRLPGVHRRAARLFGLEKINNFEYAFALLLRSVAGVMSAKSLEAVEIHLNGRAERMRLLSGVAMSFPIEVIPFKPQVDRETVSVYLIPARGRLSPLLQMSPRQLSRHARCFRLHQDQCLEIELTDRECVTFFLDEDPVATFGRLSLSVAGSIAFVPAQNYSPAKDGGSL